ncbi:hypothetical protein WICANDRAFT_86946, partial [Wickerhamomyces anomalus NRRL Y-366-8]
MSLFPSSTASHNHDPAFVICSSNSPKKEKHVWLLDHDHGTQDSSKSLDRITICYTVL